MSAAGAPSLVVLPTSTSDRLQRISEAGLVAQGRVFLLSLEPIKAQLGPRWPAREDVVWDAIEKALVKRMPPPDVFLRLNPTTVLAAVASADGYEGQVLCAEVLRSVLAFFLGRAVDADIGISRVSSLAGDGVTAAPINLSDPRPEPVANATPQPTAQTGTPTPCTTVIGRRQSTEFQSDHHGTVSISQQIVPVWRLDQGVIGAYSLRQTLSVRADLLSDTDHEKIALAATSTVVPLLESFRDTGGPFALIWPCSFSVLSARRPRMALLGRYAAVTATMRSVVVLQFEGIHPGVPPGLVRETAAMMKPFVRTLTVAVNDAAETQAAFREVAFSGLTVSAINHTAGQLETLARMARRRTPNIMVRDAPATMDPVWLKACGVSHVIWTCYPENPLPPRTPCPTLCID